mmetsp:Transcript_32634/g.79147  ORF Transcript_32634/g.79147 Transcript_32634/m.79147 type:complete len:220 (-) Transcript_32634:1914-2573(-)
MSQLPSLLPCLTDGREELPDTSSPPAPWVLFAIRAFAILTIMALLEFFSTCDSSLTEESCGPISPNELLLAGEDEFPSRSSGVVGREPECLFEISIRWALFFRMSSCAPRMAAEPVLPVDCGLAGLLVGEFPSLYPSRLIGVKSPSPLLRESMDVSSGAGTKGASFVATSSSFSTTLSSFSLSSIFLSPISSSVFFSSSLKELEAGVVGTVGDGSLLKN